MGSAGSQGSPVSQPTESPFTPLEFHINTHAHTHTVSNYLIKLGFG